MVFVRRLDHIANYLLHPVTRNLSGTDQNALNDLISIERSKVRRSYRSSYPTTSLLSPDPGGKSERATGERLGVNYPGARYSRKPWPLPAAALKCPGSAPLRPMSD